MTTCTKEFTITVEQGVLFSWQAATLQASETGTATFFPDNATGNTALAIASIGAGDVLNSLVIANAEITWNSMAILPCNMRINLMPTITAGDTDFAWALDVFNGGTLVSENNLTLGITGSFDIPFNLPNTGGLNVTVGWSILVQVSPLTTNNSGQLILEGIFTVL